MSSRLRLLLLTTAGLIILGRSVVSVVLPRAAVESDSKDDNVPQSFRRQLTAIPDTVERQVSASLSHVQDVEAVKMTRNDGSANIRTRGESAFLDEAEMDSGRRRGDMEEALKMDLGDCYDDEDEFDFMDSENAEYVNAMEFAEGYGADYDDEEELLEDLEYSGRIKYFMNSDGNEASSKVISSSTFAGVQNVRVVHPGDFFDGSSRNITYLRGGRRGDIIFEYVEYEEEDDDIDDDEFDEEDEEDDNEANIEDDSDGESYVQD